MEYDPISIISGIFLLFLSSYLLITLFTYFYLKITREDRKNKVPRIFLATFLVTLAWIVSTFLTTMFASSFGAVIFAVVSMVFIFGSVYLFANRAFILSKKEKITYPLFAGIVFNPAWLILIGIL